jgi:transposase
VYPVHEWAEVHRLYHREGRSKTAIAKHFGMSRNTVIRLLSLDAPPRYERAPTGSLLDPFKEVVAEMLGDDPEVPASVLLEHLQRRGYEGRTLNHHAGG